MCLCTVAVCYLHARRCVSIHQNGCLRIIGGNVDVKLAPDEFSSPAVLQQRAVSSLDALEQVTHCLAVVHPIKFMCTLCKVSGDGGGVTTHKTNALGICKTHPSAIQNTNNECARYMQNTPGCHTKLHK